MLYPSRYRAGAMCPKHSTHMNLLSSVWCIINSLSVSKLVNGGEQVLRVIRPLSAAVSLPYAADLEVSTPYG